VEKSTFLSDLKKHMKEFNIPDDKIDEHIAIFEEIVKEKSEEELQEAISEAGGIKALLESIYLSDAEESPQNSSADNSHDADIDNEPVKTEAVIEEAHVVETQNTPVEQQDCKTYDFDKSPDLNLHIQEAVEITTELEKTTVNDIPTVKMDDVEYIDDISDYDFESLFAKRYSKIETLILKLKEKMSDKVFKYTLPLAALAFLLIFTFVITLYALVIGSAVFLSIVYVAILVLGICFSLIPLGYGVYMMFKTIPIALYEIGIGIISIGITMLSCILIYNYTKRLVPFLYKLLKRLFKYCIKLTVLYFSRNKTEGV